MSAFIQTLESRQLFSATPTQAVIDATAKVQADLLQIKTDQAAFKAGIGIANAAFATAKSTALAALKADMHNLPGGLFSFIGNVLNTALAADRQALKDASTAHTAALKANVATWKAAHAADLATLHTDIAALHLAKAAH